MLDVVRVNQTACGNGVHRAAHRHSIHGDQITCGEIMRGEFVLGMDVLTQRPAFHLLA